MTEIKTETSDNTEQNQVQDTFSLPKNIRQMGTPGQKHKFYIEDYVYTYLHTFLKEKHKEDTLQAAVLLGRYEVYQECRYTFVNGAAACDFSVFYEGAEGQILETIREHFPDLVIVGWYVRCSGQDSHVQSVIKHYYAEKDSAISLAFVYEDELEDEFGVYVWEQNALRSLDGFYIYYEKNPQMQEFLIREKGGQVSEASEPSEVIRPLPKHRTAYEAKASGEEYKLREKKKPQKFIYAACAAVLIVVTATGITQIGDYQNLNNFQKTIQTMSGNLLNRTNKTENDNSQEEEKLSGGTDESSKNLSEEDVNHNQTAAWQDRNEDIEEQQQTDQQGSNSDNEGDSDNKEDNSQKKDADKDSTNNTEADNTAKNSAGDKEDETKAADSQKVLSESQKALNQGYYIVKKGDSLVTISRKLYKTDAMVDSICAANGIGNVDVIYEGQKLKLP